jgi:hypothetical protein
MYSHTLSDALLKVWLNATKDIDPMRLDLAFQKLSKTFVPTNACPFPVLAQLNNLFEGENSAVDFAKMNSSWQSLDEALQRYGYADLPWTPQEMFCIRAAGGWNALASATITDFQWMKKRFCEAWARWNELPEEAKQLPSKEFMQLVAENYHRGEM